MKRYSDPISEGALTRVLMGNEPNAHRSGEQRLMLAVLEDAIVCLQKNARATSNHGRRMFREAGSWIRSNSQAWPFSFVSICETLNLDPSYLRDGLLAWLERNALSGGEAELVTRKKREMDLCSSCGQKRSVKKRTAEGKSVCVFCVNKELGRPNPHYIICPKCKLGPRLIVFKHPATGKKVCQACFNRAPGSSTSKAPEEKNSIP